MQKLTLDNFNIVKGMRFRMTKEQKERGLTREQAFAETWEKVPAPVQTPVSAPIPTAAPAPAPAPIPLSGDVIEKAKAIIGQSARIPYSRLKRELGISWNRTMTVVEAATM